jgi:hypothetical protein
MAQLLGFPSGARDARCELESSPAPMHCSSLRAILPLFPMSGPRREKLPLGRLGQDYLHDYWQNYQLVRWKTDSTRSASTYDFQEIAAETNGLPTSACLRQGRRSDASSDLSTYPAAPAPSAART